METNFIKIFGLFIAIGGAALGIFPLLFRDIIGKLISAEGRRLVRVSRGMVWAVAAVGALLVVYAEVIEQHRPGSLEQISPNKRPTLGATRGLAPHPRPSSDLAEALEEQLRGASLAFNRPERLRYRQTAYIELVLAPEELGVEASTLLTPDLPGVPRQATSSYTLRMSAILSGPDFEVEPSGLQECTVVSSREARWAWTIRPLTFGPDKPLMLEVFAVLERNGRTFPPISVRTFYETILVEVGWWDHAIDAAKDIGTLHAAMAGLGGTITAIGLWLWRRRDGNQVDQRPHTIAVVRRRRWKQSIPGSAPRPR
jgi:hypothetical protein